MKSKRIIITIVVVSLIVTATGMRLASNKHYFEEQLKMVSEFNATIPVLTDTVKYQQVNSDFSVTGQFQAIREISIISELQGKVVTIDAKIGNCVKQNQLLATIDNELVKSQLDLAKFNLENTEKDKNRFEQLSKGDAATIQQFESTRLAYENAQSVYIATKLQYEHAFIKAPFNGIIVKKYIETGSFLLPGTPVFDLVEIDKVKFIAKLTTNELNKVLLGQKTKITVDAFPKSELEGIITSINVKSDPSKRFDVEIEVGNQTDNQIKPGMFGTCMFIQRSNAKILTIPRKALTEGIKNPTVFVVKNDSVIEKKLIAEILNDNQIAVLQGLKAGDVVVSSGQINLVNGSKIKITQ
jgi:membrane fusion protein, multidrug efflux system